MRKTLCTTMLTVGFIFLLGSIFCLLLVDDIAYGFAGPEKLFIKSVIGDRSTAHELATSPWIGSDGGFSTELGVEFPPYVDTHYPTRCTECHDFADAGFVVYYQYDWFVHCIFLIVLLC